MYFEDMVVVHTDARPLVSEWAYAHMDGDEVVQLYGSDLLASMLRPVHKLVVFKRVSMKAGEKRRSYSALTSTFLHFWINI